jgi:predicted DCC family thiol-disulfide oxidoreductase YuxK
MRIVSPAVLIYDGECPVCRGAADWIRARSDPGAFEFVSCHDKALSARFPFLDKTACLKAAYLVLPEGKVLTGERAAAEVLARLPGYAWLARTLRFPGVRYFSRAFYRGFARRRHSIAFFFSSRHENA